MQKQGIQLMMKPASRLSRRQRLSSLAVVIPLVLGMAGVGAAQQEEGPPDNFPRNQGRPDGVPPDRPSSAQGDAVRPGGAQMQTPTFENLGVEWVVEGDDNRNAAVDVFYREKGASSWEDGLPAFRLKGETVLPENATDDDNADRPPEQSAFYHISPNMFVANVFHLQPGTTYEIRLKISDVDGVRGRAERTLEATTRAERGPSDKGNTYHVYPEGWEGPREEPSFTGLLRAYNYGAEHADWEYAYEPRVRPGDTVLVHPGTYEADFKRYGNYTREGPGFGGPGYGVPFDGTYVLTGTGTADAPVTIKAAEGPGTVWFDGGGNHTLFNVQAADYHVFDGINIRDTNIAYMAGLKRIGGAKGLEVKNSTIEDVGVGITTAYEGSRDFHIANNTMVGRLPEDVLTNWRNAEHFADIPQEPMSAWHGVWVYGPGHVIEHNRIERFHNAIAVATFGRPDTDPHVIPEPVNPDVLPQDEYIASLDLDERYATGPSSIDIMYNDIWRIDDQCVEPSAATRSIRVMYNRCFNTAAHAMRPQPSFGGPQYFIGNVIYNTTGARGIDASSWSSGIVAYNNTIFGAGGGSGSNHHFRNNLFIGTGFDSALMSMSTLTNYTSSDYNGYAPHPDMDAPFRWNSPDFSVSRVDDRGSLVNRSFATLSEFQDVAGQEAKSTLVDLDIFRKVELPNPDEPQALYDPDDFDFRLIPGSAAVDAGVRLPGVTDHMTGEAPDLGAFERGVPIPEYGPRD